MVKIFSRTRKFLNKGQTRTILAKKNIFYSFLIKIVNIFVVMATVSLSIKLLGAENYGIWIVLSGIITWSNLFNFGFSNGLRNKLGEVLTNGNTSVGQYYVSTTYAFLFIISFIMYMLFFSLANTFDWVNVLNIKNVDNNYIVSLLLIIFSFFCFKFILGPINAILEAHQWPSVVQFITLLSAISILAILYLSSSLSLAEYVYIIAGIPVIILLVASVILFLGKYKDLRPRFSKVRKEYFSSLSKLGIAFFLLQINAIIILQTDNIIISNRFGPEKVTEYNIAQRYFGLIITFFLVVISPYWNAVTNAYAKNDLVWIKKSTNRLLQFIILCIIIVYIMYLVSDLFYAVWIGNNITIDSTLSAFMGLYVIVFSIVSIFSHFSNGVGKLRIQLIVNTFAAVINIPLSFYFASTSLGLAGVVLATICSIVVMGVFLFIQYNKVINKTAKGIWNQ